jgi:hypothetical protein
MALSVNMQSAVRLPLVECIDENGIGGRIGLEHFQ